MKDIQIHLRELRKVRNLSQEELAESLGISRQSIISLERGEFLPSLPLLLEMVSFFELPFEEIINWEGELPKKGGEEDMPRDLTTWSPFREVSTLHDAIDRMFEESFLAPRVAGVPAVNLPAVNVRETEKEVIVEAEIPGVEEKDLDIEISDDSLLIRGQKKVEEEIKEKDFYRREFSYGSFARGVALPEEVDSDKAEATLKNGTLKIVLPKITQKKPKGKKIQVKQK